MLGIWSNFGAVIVGGILGTLLRGGIPEKYRLIVNQGLGLCVLLIGVSGAIATEHTIVVIVSVVAGAFLGERLGIERGLDKMGAFAQRKLGGGDEGFATGFVNATLVFCVGAMAVVGSLNAGLADDPDTLLAKSALDGVSAVIFASSFGPGVIFAAIPMTLYQGGIALLAGVLRPLLTDTIIAEMSATGSVLIIGLAVNMLGLGKDRIRVANMLPAMFIPCLYFPLADWIAGVIRAIG